jgi:exopolysaccharide production protein ExoQ
MHVGPKPRSTAGAAGLGPAASPLVWGATIIGVVGLLLNSAAGSFAQLGVAIFLLVWVGVGAIRAGRTVRMLAASPLLWLFPALALLSVAWSQAPMVSLRAAIQFCLTVAFGILAARMQPPRAFVSAVMCGLLVGAILSLAFGRYVMDGWAGSAAYAGIFPSKNIFAFFMLLLIVFATGTAIDRGQPVPFRLLAALALVMSMPLMVLGRSAGAMVVSAVALVALFGTLAVARMHIAERAMVTAGLALVMVPAGGLVLVLALSGTLGEAATDFIQNTLGKDLTLTGRTILWQHAGALIEQRPFTGFGYYAFWLRETVHAEGLWRIFRIESRGGFHFHNLYVENAVTLGVFGAAFAAFLLWRTLGQALRLNWRDGTAATAVLVAVLACLAIRSFIEVDALRPFTIGTFILFAAAAYGSDVR